MRHLAIKKIDIYILKEFVPFFFVGFSFFNLIFIIQKLIEMMDMIIVKKVATFTVIKLFLFMLPFTFAITIPMSVLVAVLMGLGRISSDQEFIALLSAGASYWQVIKMPLVFGIVMSLGMITFNNYVLPWGNYNFKKTYYKDVYLKKPFSQLQEHRLIKIDNRTFGVDKIDEKNNILYNLVIYEKDKKTGNLIITSAKQGAWLKNKKVKDKKGTIYQIMRLELRNGSVQTYEGNEDPDFHVQKFNTFIITMKHKITEDVAVGKSAREMNFKELKKLIVKTKKNKNFTYLDNLQVEYHKKIALPFASFVFVIIGVALALLPKKTSVGYGLGISLGLIFLYYLFLTIGESLGKSGKMIPFLAMWYSNFIFTIVGSVFLFRMSK